MYTCTYNTFDSPGGITCPMPLDQWNSWVRTVATKIYQFMLQLTMFQTLKLICHIILIE